MLKPWHWVGPSVAHQLAPLALPPLSFALKTPLPVTKPVKWQDVSFPFPLGTAGGVDKDGVLIKTFFRLGAGFVEVGTVTPRPQSPNPGKIIARDLRAQTLWNYLGFPNRGLNFVKQRLTELGANRARPVLVNLGKNRATPNENAGEDYLLGLTELGPLSDGVVINISSPNTAGLRDLAQRKFLVPLLNSLVAEHRKLCRNRQRETPFLLKLSPDFEEKQFLEVLAVAAEQGVDGFVLTNTTLCRSPALNFPAHGGCSGLAVLELAREKLRWAADFFSRQNQPKLLISAGGVLDSREFQRRLDEGAQLVQIYSALVLVGPDFFRQVYKSLEPNND